MGACTFVRSAVWLAVLAGVSVSQAQEAVSAAVGSTVSAAAASEALQPKVQPLSESELPKGPSGEAIKAQTKSVEPLTTAQTILPDPGYDYMSQVNVAAIDSNETPNAAGGVTVTIGKKAGA